MCGRRGEPYQRSTARSMKRIPRDADVLPRLYWLLRLFPDLDASRHPCDWLAESLRIGGLAAPMRELYRRFVADHPEESLSERLHAAAGDAGVRANLASLIEWRRQAAGRLGKTDVIERDLSVLGPAILKDDEATWVRLLLFAADELAWLTDDGCRCGIRLLPAVSRPARACSGDVRRIVCASRFSRGSFERLEADETNGGVDRTACPGLASSSDVGAAHVGRLRLPEVRFLIMRTYDESWADADSALAFFDEVQNKLARSCWPSSRRHP